MNPSKKKLASFNLNVKKINGHDINQIIIAINQLNKKNKRPNIIIADTVKGKGVSFMENTILWHYKSPTAKQLKLALSELK